MERRFVHDGPLPFTIRAAELGIRPAMAATVQGGSPRMVTSLVTSHRSTATQRPSPTSRPPPRSAVPVRITRKLPFAPRHCPADPADIGNMERRERWFSDGASALRRTLTAMGMEDSLPSGGQFYPCPLCLMAYGRDAFEGGVFSDEHVPPRTAGGRALVLTCRRSAPGQVPGAALFQGRRFRSFNDGERGPRLVTPRVGRGDPFAKRPGRRHHPLSGARRLLAGNPAAPVAVPSLQALRRSRP